MAARRAAMQIEKVAPESLVEIANSYSLPFFPLGEPDERFDSRIGRFHVQLGTRAVDTTYRRLFDRGPFYLGQWLPSRLDRLAQKLPGDPTTNLEALCQQSTLLPLFEQFGGERFSIHAKENSPGENARWVQGDANMTQLCPACLVDDENECGWPFIHRAHNIPGVIACWKHGTLLHDRCPVCRCPFQPPASLVLAPWLGCTTCHASIVEAALPMQKQASEIEIAYAKFTHALLEVAPIKVSSTQLVLLYRNQAIQQGFGKKSLIDRKKLASAIEAMFGVEMLRRLDPAYDTSRADAWFHVLGQQSAEAPLNRHLILSQFLFTDASLFIEHLRSQRDGKVTTLTKKVKNIGKGKQSNIQLAANKKIDLLDDLVSQAIEHNLNIEGLWKERYGDMKRLMRSQADAGQVIEERLKNRLAKVLRSKRPIRSRSLNPEDEVWSGKINSAAQKLYASNMKPARVSQNLLLKTASLPRPIDSLSSPVAHTALLAHSESIWHFYARRLVWNMRSLKGSGATELKATRGLNPYRMLDIYEHLKRHEDFLCNSEMPICTALEGLGIKPDWVGPCPGKPIRVTGRAYQKVGRSTKARRLKETGNTA